MAVIAAGAWAAARAAADHLVGRAADPSVPRAVLAQWIAENGWSWPPPRNNPGNLARGWAANFSYPFYWTEPNPQPGNPIVTFRRLGDGSEAYSAGLRAFGRYALAVASARAGRGLDFAVGVCRSGYGTRESTVRTVYAALGGHAEPAPQPAPIGGHDPMIRYAQVTGTRYRMRLGRTQILREYPGGPPVTTMSKDGSVPLVGLATVAGKVWRAVLVGTGASYTDGRTHPTVVWVPDSAGEVVPT